MSARLLAAVAVTAILIPVITATTTTTAPWRDKSDAQTPAAASPRPTLRRLSGFARGR